MCHLAVRRFNIWKHKTLPLYSSHKTLLPVPETYRDNSNDPKPGLMSSRVRTKTNLEKCHIIEAACPIILYYNE